MSGIITIVRFKILPFINIKSNPPTINVLVFTACFTTVTISSILIPCSGKEIISALYLSDKFKTVTISESEDKFSVVFINVSNFSSEEYIFAWANRRDDFCL